MQVTVQRTMAHGFQAQSAFTWAKSMDAATVANIANGDEINDPKNLHWSRGISNANVPFAWVSNFIARSPGFKSQSLLMREALGGWELSPIITWQSGTPFNIGGGNSQSAYGELNYGSGCLSACGSDRADRVPGIPLKVRQGGRGSWTKEYFNPAAFTTRHDGTFGDSARNMIQGPPGFNVDAAMMKQFSIMERYDLQFRFELFNAFNHPIMGNPDTTPTDSCFGEINCYNNGFGSPTNTTRIGQAAMKFTF
jgi:hypothetical protein